VTRRHWPVLCAAAFLAGAAFVSGRALAETRVGFSETRWRLVDQPARGNVWTSGNQDPDARLYRFQGAPELSQLVQSDWNGDLSGFKLVTQLERDKRDRNTVPTTLKDPGLYVLAWRSQPNEPRYTRFLVSDLRAICLRDGSDLVIWCWNARSGAPVEGASAKLYQGQEAKALPATDNNGVVRVPAPAADKWPGWALLRDGEHFAVAPVPSRTSRDRPKVHLVTDRLSYEAGQPVRFQCVVREWRDGAWRPVANKEVSISASQRGELGSANYKTDEYGVCRGTWDVPAPDRTTWMALHAQAGGADAWQSFCVSPSRNLEATLRTEKPVYKRDEQIIGHLTAIDRFGKPVVGAQVTWQVIGSQWYVPPTAAAAPSWLIGNTALLPQYAYYWGRTQATARTDAQGHARLEIPSLNAIGVEDMPALTILAQVDEPGGPAQCAAQVAVDTGPKPPGPASYTGAIDAEKALLELGDVLRLKLSGPNSAPKAKGLLVVFNDRTSRVVPIPLPSEGHPYELRLGPEHVGPLYVRLMYPGPAPQDNDYWSDARLTVYQRILVVQPKAQLLNVVAQSAGEHYRPGDEVSLRISLADEEGVDRPRLSLSVAENLRETNDDPLQDLRQALYRLDPPGEYINSPGVATSNEGEGWPGLTPAWLTYSLRPDSGYAWQPLPAQRLLHTEDDLAIRPGATETIRFKATQPGRYRAVVCAVDTTGAVGQAVAEFEVEQPPLELALAAPSYLTIGDQGSAQAIVHNTSAEVQTATLVITAPGLRPDPGRKAVEVQPGERLRVPIALEAREAGDLRLQAELRIGKATVTTEHPVHVQEAAKPAGPGEAMALRRQYLRVVHSEGKTSTEPLRGPAAPGDEIEVRLGVKLDQDCERLVLQDSVPGGCQLSPSSANSSLSPRLAALVDWLGFAQYQPYWQGQQAALAPPVVDGKVALVSEKLKAGVHDVAYRLVALDPGVYAIGPLVARAKIGDRELWATYAEPDHLRIAERGEIRLASARLNAQQVEVGLEADNPRSDEVAGTLLVSFRGLDGTRRNVLEQPYVLKPGHATLTRDLSRPQSVEGAMVEVAFRSSGMWLSDARSLQSLAGRQSLRLLGQNELAAGSTASVRLIALTEADSKPIAGANVELALLPKEGREPTLSLLTGRTNDKGTLEASFQVPTDAVGDHRLAASVSSPYGEETVEQPVAIKDPTRILLTTDKPLYQPTQQMHIRCLALRQYDLKPMKQTPATLEIEDGKGNKVFKHIGKTSDFGVLAADFQLADWVNEGDYRIRALVGETQLEKTVTVRKYVLPKFKVQVETDKQFYFPGDLVKGSVQCDYFFGKPVRGGKVTLIFSSFVEKFEEFARVSGTTDDKGHWDFETTLPDHFVGQPLTEGNATVQIEAQIVDTADHKETKYHALTVSAQPMNVVVLPESGTLVPGVPNTVYVAVNYPDGSPVPAAALKVTNKADGQTLLDGKTDELGLAQFAVLPQQESLNLGITATDSNGRQATHERTVSPEQTGEALLLRTSKALAKVGDRLDVSVLSNAKRGTVYLDLIKNRQTLLTKTVDLDDGQGSFSLPLTPDMSGTIALSAYKITLSGEIVRDQRPVYVEPANDLQINVVPDASMYEPGQPARIDFHVTDRQGKGVLAALGVTIVDESVFALQEVQPGLLKVYFTLEKEILQPRYQIKGFQMPDLVVAKEGDEKAKPEQVRERAAEVLMAGAAQIADYTLNVNTRQDRESVAVERAGKILNALRSGNYFYQYRQQRDSYFKAHQAYPEQEKGVFYLAELKRIKPEDCLDPWGHAYAMGFGPGPYGPRLRITSAGPDGVQGTLDDIEPPDQGEYYSDYYYVLTDSARELLQQSAREMPVVFAPGQVDGLQARGRRFFTWSPGVGYGYGGFKGDSYEATVGMGMPSAGLGLMASGRQAKASHGITDLDGRSAYGPPGAKGEPGPRGGEGAAAVGAPVEREVRIREWFPETLYCNPQVITDEQGRASIDLTMADSITEWRLTALGSSPGGLLGSRSLGVKAFQDFFVDIDLPVALTQNDEATIPIAIYNYLKEPQRVRIKLNQEDWFSLQSDAEQEVTLQPEEVKALHYKLKVTGIGRHALTAVGHGTHKSDAIKRQIEVVPDGKEFRDTINDRLPKDGCTHTVKLPDQAIPEASRLWVKVYPGVFSQVVEGLDSMFRLPFG